MTGKIPPITLKISVLSVASCSSVSLNRSARLLVIQDPQRVFRGEGAIGLRLAHCVVIVIEFVTVMDQVGIGGHWYQAFPAIGHEQGGAHRKEIGTDHDLGLDAVPPHRLLPAIQGHLDRIQIVRISKLLFGSQIRKSRPATGQQQRGD